MQPDDMVHFVKRQACLSELLPQWSILGMGKTYLNNFVDVQRCWLSAQFPESHLDFTRLATALHHGYCGQDCLRREDRRQMWQTDKLNHSWTKFPFVGTAALCSMFWKISIIIPQLAAIKWEKCYWRKCIIGDWQSLPVEHLERGRRKSAWE